MCVGLENKYGVHLVERQGMADAWAQLEEGLGSDSVCMYVGCLTPSRGEGVGPILTFSRCLTALSDGHRDAMPRKKKRHCHASNLLAV